MDTERQYLKVLQNMQNLQQGWSVYKELSYLHWILRILKQRSTYCIVILRTNIQNLSAVLLYKLPGAKTKKLTKKNVFINQMRNPVLNRILLWDLTYLRWTLTADNTTALKLLRSSMNEQLQKCEFFKK